MRRHPPLRLRTTPQLRIRAGSETDTEPYLLFPVEGASGTIRSAKLRLYAYDRSKDGPAIYKTGNDWTEDGITWRTRPARSGRASDNEGAVAANTWVEYDVTPLVTGDGEYGFLIQSNNEDGVDFRSREYETASQRPVLVVTYAP